MGESEASLAHIGMHQQQSALVSESTPVQALPVKSKADDDALVKEKLAELQAMVDDLKKKKEGKF